jgi:hypothetical protein
MASEGDGGADGIQPVAVNGLHRSSDAPTKRSTSARKGGSIEGEKTLKDGVPHQPAGVNGSLHKSSPRTGASTKGAGGGGVEGDQRNDEVGSGRDEDARNGIYSPGSTLSFLISLYFALSSSCSSSCFSSPLSLKPTL